MRLICKAWTDGPVQQLRLQSEPGGRFMIRELFGQLLRDYDARLDLTL